MEEDLEKDKDDNGNNQPPNVTGSQVQQPKEDLTAPINAPVVDTNLHLLNKKKNLYKLKTKSYMPSVDGSVVDLNAVPLGDHRFVPFDPVAVKVTLPERYEPTVRKATQYLLQTFITCNPTYNYQPINNPKRFITKLAVPSATNQYDNEDCDYILSVNDILGSTEGHQFQVLDSLGCGTFGQVVKCRNIKTKELVALKVIKNKPAYYNQSLVEVAILDLLNKQYDSTGKHHIVRMVDSFVYQNHLCIAFEMLSVNLYELIKQNNHRGLSTNLIRMFIIQILDALTILSRAKLIHCDLKPENILLKTLESPSIKVIDFGSACHENQTVYTYIQSRFYRAPEVLLGLSYNGSIDIWSVGCIAAELFLGLPLFPGTSEYNQVSRIVELLGIPPYHMCDKGKTSHRYFNKVVRPDQSTEFQMKTREQYEIERSTTEQPSKRYFTGNTLAEIINGYPIMRRGLSNREIELEMQNRKSFIDFLGGLLRLNPLERWTAQQALQHPFITQKPFVEPYNPLINVKVNSAKSPDTHTRSSGSDGAKYRVSQESQLRKSFTVPSKNTLPYENMMGVMPPAKDHTNMDDKYHQVVGTFSEFQINNQPSSSLPESYQNTKEPPAERKSLSQSVTSQEFPMRKAKSNYSVSEAYQSMASGSMHPVGSVFSRQGSFTEGHPRYGDFGERMRLPSRMPSAAVSVDWELFKDYEGSVSGSVSSSRQNSFVDMADKRHSISYHSPGQQRKFAQSSRRMGSFSNDSMNEYGYFGRSSDTGVEPSSPYGSPMNHASFSKKQRSNSLQQEQLSPTTSEGTGELSGNQSSMPIDLPKTKRSNQ